MMDKTHEEHIKIQLADEPTWFGKVRMESQKKMLLAYREILELKIRFPWYKPEPRRVKVIYNDNR